MDCKTVGKTLCRLFILPFLALILMQQANACTRAVYLGPDNTIITARSMDWAEDTGTDLWAFPRGMKREGAAGPTSITWVSKYGSVISSFYGVGSVDGINENGLVANVLYLTESQVRETGRQTTYHIYNGLGSVCAGQFRLRC